MNFLKFLNLIKWFTALSFVLLIIIEKLNYLEGYPTTESELFGRLSKFMTITFFIISFYELRLVVKKKDEEIEFLKNKFNEKT